MCIKIHRFASLCVILLILLSSFQVVAQDIDYAKAIVSTLASDEFKGRGYVDNGDRIAADFLQSEFEKIGLFKYDNSYFQKFTTPVNTFPGQLKLIVNEMNLRPGMDFLVAPGSPKKKGTFKTTLLEMDDILDIDRLSKKLREAKDKFLIVPDYNKKAYSKIERNQISEVFNLIKYHPELPIAGSIFLKDTKLTWSGSTVVRSTPSFDVLGSSIEDPIQQVSLEVKNKFIKKHKTQNVLGYIEGERADSLIVFTAHYDHLGMMGDVIFPGANDNASGIAMLLNLAKHFAANKPKYNTAFIAFGAEELGLVGAKYFVENPVFNLSKIKFLLNFDLAGTGDEGIQVVNGSVYQKKFDRLTQLNNEAGLLEEVRIRGEACNSDHCMFYRKGVPCFYIYTRGGIQAYHDIYDKAETLPLTEFEDYFKLIVMFTETL